MARGKSNSELVKEFFAAERNKGMTYFFGEVIENYSPRNIVFRRDETDHRVPVSGRWLKERIRLWLIANGEVRTDKQLINLTKAVIANVPGTNSITAA